MIRDPKPGEWPLGLTTTVGGGQPRAHGPEPDRFVLPPGYLNHEDTVPLLNITAPWNEAIPVGTAPAIEVYAWRDAGVSDATGGRYQVGAPIWLPSEQPTGDPVAALKRCMAQSPPLNEPMTATVDENGVVVLRDRKGAARAWMGQDTYVRLYEYVNGDPLPAPAEDEEGSDK